MTPLPPRTSPMAQRLRGAARVGLALAILVLIAACNPFNDRLI